MAESIKELRKICGKAGKPKDIYAVFIRAISIYFTKLFLYTPLTANQVSILGFLIGILAAAFFMFGTYPYSLAGAFLLFFAHILDCVDGDIARYRKQFSIKGCWLEDIFHRAMSPIILLSIGYGLYKTSGDIMYLYLGILASFSQLVYTCITFTRKIVLLSKTGSCEDVKEAYNTDEKLGKSFKISRIFASLYYALLSDEWRMVLIVLASLFSYLHVFLIFYGIFLPLRSVVLISLMLVLPEKCDKK